MKRFTIGKYQRYEAFTLAEVLITLTIIGIVAAMVIPVINNAVTDLQLKTAFKKAYSIASQAWAQVVTKNSGVYTAKGGWSCTWADGTSGDFNANDGRIDAIKTEMKVIKSCVHQTGCWADSYEYDNILGGGTTIGSSSPYDYSWTTTDGMCWAAPYKGLDETHLLVDVNCNTQPNIIGRDIFSFMLGVDGIVYFAIDDRSSTGKPVSSGLVCPLSSDPRTIVNGRSVSLKSLLYN